MSIHFIGDDAFFQSELGWSVLGLLASGFASSWIIGAEIGCCSAGLQALGMTLLCKNKEEGGSARALPMAAPMPKSVSHLEER